MSRPDQTELNAARDAAANGEWELANDILHGFGIEFVSCADRELQYINLGDTYSTTVCAQEGEKPFIGSWGEWYEETESEYCEEEGVIRCGYCSEFTPLEEDKNWSETVCQYCGHLVGG